MATSHTKANTRRLSLLDAAIDYALRSDCRFAFCDGPIAPVRHMKTCSRCQVLNRAIKMKLVAADLYRGPNGGYRFTQFSAVDGKQVC